MAKKKHTLGKLLALTTAAAAVGGTCYIFRDKIKACPLYKKCSDVLSQLTDRFADTEDDDDLLFDDEDDFEADDFEDVFDHPEHGREYTSITINAKATDKNEESETDTKVQDADEKPTENTEVQDEEAEEVIPIIPFQNETRDSKIVTDEASKEHAAAAEVSGYENEGLSDVSEDPDTLEDQDRLDF